MVLLRVGGFREQLTRPPRSQPSIALARWPNRIERTFYLWMGTCCAKKARFYAADTFASPIAVRALRMDYVT